MASKTFIFLPLLLLFSASGALGGGITCESLGKSTCAYAVSSAGMRCLLEKHVRRGGQEVYTCGTSDIEADGIKDRVETDECVEACGLNRGTLGISSDSLLDSNFRQKLCSPACYRGCPNVVDLYFNLAAGEGVFLPKLCEAQETNVRRAMAEIRSSGASLAASSESGKVDASAPTRSRVLFAPAEPPM
ncbi:uncharacterized protein [Elaeis guineensis]|uniref:Uncharacterized protein LOC105054842 isoform X1 n=1 Tax=Elaeis guineensis var. tenera TaxID=51953 RepID=A0A6I9RZR7_ELAGV|nr:uncharacterized protein LOC105054842 isoform X1 [Elaeis guineensis]